MKNFLFVLCCAYACSSHKNEETLNPNDGKKGALWVSASAGNWLGGLSKDGRRFVWIQEDKEGNLWPQGGEADWGEEPQTFVFSGLSGQKVRKIRISPQGDRVVVGVLEGKDWVLKEGPFGDGDFQEIFRETSSWWENFEIFFKDSWRVAQVSKSFVIWDLEQPEKIWKWSPPFVYPPKGIGFGDSGFLFWTPSAAGLASFHWRHWPPGESDEASFYTSWHPGEKDDLEWDPKVLPRLSRNGIVLASRSHELLWQGDTEREVLDLPSHRWRQVHGNSGSDLILALGDTRYSCDGDVYYGRFMGMSSASGDEPQWLIPHPNTSWGISQDLCFSLATQDRGILEMMTHEDALGERLRVFYRSRSPHEGLHFLEKENNHYRIFSLS